MIRNHLRRHIMSIFFWEIILRKGVMHSSSFLTTVVNLPFNFGKKQFLSPRYSEKRQQVIPRKLGNQLNDEGFFLFQRTFYYTFISNGLHKELAVISKVFCILCEHLLPFFFSTSPSLLNTLQSVPVWRQSDLADRRGGLVPIDTAGSAKQLQQVPEQTHDTDCPLPHSSA